MAAPTRMTKPVPITVAHGDGIDPEIMEATLTILKEAGPALEIETIEIGEKVYLRGNTAGIDPSAWESLRRTKVFLKAPITTPQGGGFKSLNVTARKRLGLYANVRPCVSYHPFVETKHPNMDVVIVRENEEDLYAGIEHRQTADVTQCLKLISRPGSERIVRYAFEYARRNGRKKVTCFTKDNIMKITDGLFHRVFDEIAAEYPDIEKEHWIVHIGQPDVAARVHNAWLRTLEDGVHTYDIFQEGVSREKVGTREFAGAVVARLGQQPQTLRAANYAAAPKQTATAHSGAARAAE